MTCVAKGAGVGGGVKERGEVFRGKYYEREGRLLIVEMRYLGEWNMRSGREGEYFVWLKWVFFNQI